MSIVDKLWLYDVIETKIKDLINKWGANVDVKNDISTYTYDLINFDKDNIVWNKEPTIEELEQSKKVILKLEMLYEIRKDLYQIYKK